MKKGISIFFALVMICSSAHVTIATHFCCGEIAAKKISFSGELASCGMEGNERSCPSPGSILKTHCCDNKTTTIGILNIYSTPSAMFSDQNQPPVHISFSPYHQAFSSTFYSYDLSTDSGPPLVFSNSSVDLNIICTFRI